MEKFVLFIKTYKKDFNSFIRLIKSINAYNIDSIPVFVSVNDKDYKFFKRRLKENIFLYKDSDLYECKIKDGWRYQQIIKIQLFRLHKVENYLCIDSDSYFIKPFKIDDFIVKNTPYFIKHESKDFLASMQKIGKSPNELFFINALFATRKILNISSNEIWDYGPSPYIWNCNVWQNIFAFLDSKNFTIESFFNELDKIYLPSENTIYGEYLSLTNNQNYIVRKEFFKVYHYKEQYRNEKKDMNSKYIYDNYFGIILQSNWENSFIKKFKNIYFSFYSLLYKL